MPNSLAWLLTLASGALRVNSVIERPIAVQGDALNPSQFSVDIFDAAFALGELLVLARLASLLWKEQGTLETRSKERRSLEKRPFFQAPPFFAQLSCFVGVS